MANNAYKGISQEQSSFQKVIGSMEFEIMMLFIIFLNCIMLAVQAPRQEQSFSEYALFIFFNIIYVVDFSMRIAAFGIVHILRKKVRILDGIVAILSLIDILMMIISKISRDLNQHQVARNVDGLKIISILKVLRIFLPLKALSFMPMLGKYFKALSHSIRDVILNTSLLCLTLSLLAVIFHAVIGDGLSYRCVPTDITNPNVYTSELYQEFGESIYYSSYNTVFCGYNPCQSGFGCMKLSNIHFLGIQGDFTTPWNSFITLTSFITLRGWSHIFWAINDAQGPVTAVFVLIITPLTTALLITNMYPAILIVTMKKNEQRMRKRQLLQSYPGNIAEISELELIVWSNKHQHLIQQLKENVNVQRYIANFVEKKKSQLKKTGKRDEEDGEEQDEAKCLPNCAGCSTLRHYFTEDDSYFNHFIMGVVLLNIFFLSINTDDASTSLVGAMYYSEILFIAIYIIEVCIKFFILGPCHYFGNLLNVIDFIVSVMLYAKLNPKYDIPNFVIIFRLFRLFSLLKHYGQNFLKELEHRKTTYDPKMSFMTLMSFLFEMKDEYVAFVLLVLIALYIYSLVGLQIFNNVDFEKYTIGYDNILLQSLNITKSIIISPHDGNGLLSSFNVEYTTQWYSNQISRFSYANFPAAFVTIFNLMNYNAWYEIMINTIVETQSSISAWFYLIWVIISNYIIVGVFIARIFMYVEQFASRQLTLHAKINIEIIRNLELIKVRFLKKYYFRLFKKATAANQAAQYLERTHNRTHYEALHLETNNFITTDHWYSIFAKRRHYHSFYLLSPNNLLRKYSTIVVNSAIFQFIIAVAIILATISIITSSNAIFSPNGWKYIDLIIPLLFYIEMFLLWISQTVYGHPESYFSYKINILDFCVNTLLVLSYFPVLKFPFFYFAIFKIPKFFIYVSSNKTMKNLYLSYQSAYNSLFYLTLIMFAGVVFFAVVGMELWQSGFGKCSYVNYPAGVSMYSSSENFPFGCAANATLPIIYTSIPPEPTSKPTRYPTFRPTHDPTSHPSHFPTTLPTFIPSSYAPSYSNGTVYPTTRPSHLPTIHPTGIPSHKPTSMPSSFPTTSTPTSKPTTSPSSRPTTLFPTSKPSSAPTIRGGTRAPTSIPSTRHPSSRPSPHPTALKSSHPTFPVTLKPTRLPTIAYNTTLFKLTAATEYYRLYWQEPINTFDDFFAACKSVFKIALVNNWADIMFSAMDYVDTYTQPRLNSNKTTFLFFLLLGILGIIMGALYTGAIYYHYLMSLWTGKQRLIIGENEALWVDFEEKLTYVRRIDLDSSISKARSRLLYRILYKNEFYRFFMTAYCIIPIILMISYPSTTYDRLYYLSVDAGFSTYYILEYLLRQYLFHFRLNSKNRYEFIVAIVLLMEILICMLANPADGKKIVTRQLVSAFLHLASFLRLFRLMICYKTFGILVKTLIQAIPSVLAIIFVIMFILLAFSEVARISFKYVELNFENSFIAEHYHFKYHLSSFITLFSMITGNIWSEIISPLKRYYTGAKVSLLWSIYIELLFTIVYIIFYIFYKSVFIILTKIYSDNASTAIRLANQQIHNFQKTWLLRVDNKGEVSLDRVIHFLQALKAPLGYAGDARGLYIDYERFLKLILISLPQDSQSLHVPRYTYDELPSDLRNSQACEDYYSFQQVLIAVHKVAMLEIELPDEKEYQFQRFKHGERLQIMKLRLGRLLTGKSITEKTSYSLACMRKLSILQRVNPTKYRQYYVTIMENAILNIKKRIQSFGFRTFDAFYMNCILRGAKHEMKASSLLFKVKSSLNPNNVINNWVMKQEFQEVKQYHDASQRLYENIQELYNQHVTKLWKADTLYKAAVLHEKENIAVSCVAIDHQNTIYVGYVNGMFRIFKQMTDIPSSRRSKMLQETSQQQQERPEFHYKLQQTIKVGNDPHHPVQTITLSLDNFAIFVGCGNEAIMYVQRTRRNKQKTHFVESKRFKEHTAAINVIIHYHKYLVTASQDGYVILYSLVNSQVLTSSYCGSPIYCMKQINFIDDIKILQEFNLTSVDCIACGTAAGYIKVLSLPVHQYNTESDNFESSWNGYSIYTDKNVGISSLHFAWKYLYTGYVDGTIKVWAVQLSTSTRSIFGMLMQSKQFSIDRVMQLICVNTQSVHTGPITSIHYTGGHLFTASHDFSMLPWSPPNKLNAKTAAEFSQSPLTGYIAHSNAIVSMHCNNQAIVSGDDNGTIVVSTPAILGDNLKTDGGDSTSSMMNIFQQVSFSFLEYDFRQCFIPQNGCVLEEECYLDITNISESPLVIKCMYQTQSNFSVDLVEDTSRPTTGLNINVTIQPNGTISYRIVFVPTECRLYSTHIGFLLNNESMIDIVLRGNGIKSYVAVEGGLKSIDFETVIVGQALTRATKIVNISNRAVILNLYDESIPFEDDNTMISLASRNITISPQCFQLDEGESIEITIKFSPTAEYPYIDIPLKFTCNGAIVSLLNIKGISEKQENAATGAIVHLPDANAQLAKLGLRPLEFSQSLCPGELTNILLDSYDYRISVKPTSALIFQPKTGIFIDIVNASKLSEWGCDQEVYTVKLSFQYQYINPFVHPSSPLAAEVDKTSIYYQRDKVLYGEEDIDYLPEYNKRHFYELWLDDRLLACGGVDDGLNIIELNGNHIFFHYPERGEDILETIGYQTIELYIYSHGKLPRQKQNTSNIRPKYTTPESITDCILYGGLKTITSIKLAKGFRFCKIFEDELYKPFERVTVIGIESMISFLPKNMGYGIQLFDNERNGVMAAEIENKVGSALYSPVKLMIHNTSNATHYNVVETIQTEKILLDETFHNANGTEVVLLTRPIVPYSQQTLDRVLAITLSRKETTEQTNHFLSVENKNTEICYVCCHHASDVIQRSIDSGVLPYDLLPHKLTSTPFQLTVQAIANSATEQAIEERRSEAQQQRPNGSGKHHRFLNNNPLDDVPTSLESDNRLHSFQIMFDQLLNNQQTISSTLSSFFNGLWYFIVDDNQLKLVSADPEIGQYAEQYKINSVDIIFGSYGLAIALEDNSSLLTLGKHVKREEHLDLDDDHHPGIQVRSQLSQVISSGIRTTAATRNNIGLIQKVIRQFNKFGLSFDFQLPAKFFLQQWEHLCYQEQCSQFKLSLMKLVELRQQEMKKALEVEIIELKKEQAKVQALINTAQNPSQVQAQSKKTMVKQSEREKTLRKALDSLSTAKTYKEIYEEIIRLVEEYISEWNGNQAKDAPQLLATITLPGSRTTKLLSQSCLLRYLDQYVLPSYSKPLNHFEIDMLLRDLTLMGCRGYEGKYITLENFKLWYNSHSNEEQLQKELQDQYIFSILLEQEQRYLDYENFNTAAVGSGGVRNDKEQDDENNNNDQSRLNDRSLGRQLYKTFKSFRFPFNNNTDGGTAAAATASSLEKKLSASMKNSSRGTSLSDVLITEDHFQNPTNELDKRHRRSSMKGSRSKMVGLDTSNVIRVVQEEDDIELGLGNNNYAPLNTNDTNATAAATKPKPGFLASLFTPATVVEEGEDSDVEESDIDGDSVSEEESDLESDSSVSDLSSSSGESDESAASGSSYNDPSQLVSTSLDI